MDMMSSPYGTSVCERMASRVKSPSDLIRCALGILGSPSTQMTRWHPLSQTHRKLYVVYLFFTVQTLLFVDERWLLIGGSRRRKLLSPRWTGKHTLKSKSYCLCIFLFVNTCTQKRSCTKTLCGTVHHLWQQKNREENPNIFSIVYCFCFPMNLLVFIL